MTPAALLFLALGASAADVPAYSSGPARQLPPPENPWSLSYGLDRRGSRYGRLDYRLRWSFSDLDSTLRDDERPREGRAAERTLRGLLQGSSLELYGVRMRLFRDLPLSPATEFAVPASTANAGGRPPASPSRHRRHYTWDRLYKDLEDSARREAERFIVREGFDRALPAHKGAPFGQKKALGDGLLELGRGTLDDESSGP